MQRLKIWFCSLISVTVLLIAASGLSGMTVMSFVLFGKLRWLSRKRIHITKAGIWVRPSETFANRMFAAEPTGMYSWRVSEGLTRVAAVRMVPVLKNP